MIIYHIQSFRLRSPITCQVLLATRSDAFSDIWVYILVLNYLDELLGDKFSVYHSPKEHMVPVSHVFRTEMELHLPDSGPLLLYVLIRLLFARLRHPLEMSMLLPRRPTYIIWSKV